MIFRIADVLNSARAGAPVLELKWPSRQMAP
jgi:hypothetical protein